MKKFVDQHTSQLSSVQKIEISHVIIRRRKNSIIGMLWHKGLWKKKGIYFSQYELESPEQYWIIVLKQKGNGTLLVLVFSYRFWRLPSNLGNLEALSSSRYTLLSCICIQNIQVELQPPRGSQISGPINVRWSHSPHFFPFILTFPSPFIADMPAWKLELEGS